MGVVAILSSSVRKCQYYPSLDTDDGLTSSAVMMVLSMRIELLVIVATLFPRAMKTGSRIHHGGKGRYCVRSVQS